MTNPEFRFSRSNPSRRYRELISIYSQMHADRSDIFAGNSLRSHLLKVRLLVQKTGAKTLLDYGSGKGLFYEQRNFFIKNVGKVESIAQYLGVNSIRCYDPCVPRHSVFPVGERFDGVISTDALEHIPEDDMPWVVLEMFEAADKFVFANIESSPARKVLPTGENAHATQRGLKWWRNLCRKAASDRGGAVLYRFEIEQTLHSCKWLPFREISHVITNA